MSDGETSIFTGSMYREDVNTWNVAVENGSDLHVNERQTIRHYRARSTEEEEEERRAIIHSLTIGAHAQRGLQ